MCDNNKVFGRYGSAFPMYFKFIKYCIYLLTFMLLITGIINISNIMNGDYCDERLNTDEGTLFLKIKFLSYIKIAEYIDDDDNDLKA